MKTSEQIYSEVETRWAEKKSERKRAGLSRIVDMVLLVVPWAVVFAWSIAGHQPVVAGLCVPFLVGSCFQLQKWWRLEDRVERLEREK